MIQGIAVNSESTLISIKAIFSETVSVSEFSDGLEIVEKYKSEYDIILMDIQMKHMDGMQAAMRIRDIDKKCHHYIYYKFCAICCAGI